MPVHLLRTGGVAAVWTEVPDAGYTEDALNARLEDLRWVGERGIAHERVLDWFIERTTIVPLSPFSLHSSIDRLRDRISADAPRFIAVLDRLRGRQEWGVKLWRDRSAALKHADELSPALAEISREIDAATPGKRFLLQKKRDGMLDDELRIAGQALAKHVLGELEPRSEGAAALDVPGVPATAERALMLHAVFLVDSNEFDAFHRRVSELAMENRGRGFELELTGPWPAYHFTEAPYAAQPD